MAVSRIAIVALVAAVSGCKDPFPMPPPEPWQTAPYDHQCSVEQMAKVEAETKFCNDNTTYYKTACYGASILRNCTKRGQP